MKIHVYPGAAAGVTYDCEKGAGKIARFHWDNAAGKLSPAPAALAWWACRFVAAGS